MVFIKNRKMKNFFDLSNYLLSLTNPMRLVKKRTKLIFNRKQKLAMELFTPLKMVEPIKLLNI